MAASILKELDGIIRAATALRERLADVEVCSGSPTLTNVDIAPPHPAEEVDTWTASERLGIPIDTVRWLAREKGFGVKRGGRWLVRLDDLRRYQREA